MHHRKSQCLLTPLEVENAWNTINQAEVLVELYPNSSYSLTQAQHILDVTHQILKVNPDASSLLLMRRRAISTLLPEDAAKAVRALLAPNQLQAEQSLLEAELEFFKLLAPIKPIKAYTLWHHIMWILCASLRCSVKSLEKSEVDHFNPIPDSWTTISAVHFLNETCGKDSWMHQVHLPLSVLNSFDDFAINELRKDGRNFHCWSFLTLVHRLLVEVDDRENRETNQAILFMDRLGDIADAELDRSDYHNSSAFHIRRVIKSDIATELSWLRHACLAVPDREGPWIHLECVIYQEMKEQRLPREVLLDLVTEFLNFLRRGWADGEEAIPVRVVKAKRMLADLLTNDPLFLSP